MREHASPAVRSSAQADQVQRLLNGEEAFDLSELAYDFECHHLGAIAVGEGAADGLREVARFLDQRLLLVRGAEGEVWAWLAGRRVLDPASIERHLSAIWPLGARLAIGQAAYGLAGWRLTHRQACAALPIAKRCQRSFTRYSDVALLASVLQDDLLATSLHQLYLAPLEQERDGGETLRRTLRAYLATGRNASSAAAILRVSRRTVSNRLRVIEERLERPLSSFATEIDAALRMRDFDSDIG